MKSKQQVKLLIAERDYIFMFMEEVELTTAFWLWHKYASNLQHGKPKWDYNFKIFLISAFHSSLLSIRKLNDFFSSKDQRPDALKADRFQFKNMAQPLSGDALKSLNKYLAHLTYSGVELRFQEWNIDDYACPIYLRSLEFCQHLEKNYLDPKMDAEILKKLAIFQRDLQAHIKRVCRVQPIEIK